MPNVDRQLSDYLAANESWKRTLRLRLRTDALLRQGGGRQQARKQAQLLEDARVQVREQMRSQRRRAFRGEVSVSVTIFARGVAEPPSAPKTIKRYLDALIGLAYRDDEQVAHLEVRRWASDHPHFRGRAATESEPGEDKSPVVSIEITPLRVYVADYDRAFLGSPWEQKDDPFVDDHLDYWLRDREADVAGQGPYAAMDEDQRVTLRNLRERMISRALSERILHRHPDPWDRPGPRPLAWLGDLAPSTPTAMGRRADLPGEFWLPSPARGSWATAVRRRMAEHQRKWDNEWGALPAAFDEPLAVDIAAHGDAGRHRDIDNLASPILAAFEEVYCAGRRGTVVSYRAYRTEEVASGVRIIVMRGHRLRELEDAINDARQRALERGPND
ncbi:MAG TPA: hypothetical protein VHB30_12000 [Solirubrobacteraceae bacterium]|nr:hypothetical protein [Solirubrobacteraceae bacterium]